ncbi:STAS/SEC14 domain-containing protein [Actinoplanes sp. NBC_00393]|uniref:STAS/SEC14 domain-containing protein n=1 Tax=Actinoplanes sp. NBC_00393 TaxID=2975953 RepID=UPI002E21B00A
MIEELGGLPDGVLGFRFAGPVTREEYLGVFRPPLQAALEGGQGIRLVLVIDQDFGWFQPGAFWEDLKFGLGPGTEHHKAWERMAIVSDADWVRHALGLFGFLVPGAARVFPGTGLDEAKAWLAA